MFKITLLVGIFLLLNLVKAGDEDDDSITMDEALQGLKSFIEDYEPIPTDEQIKEILKNKKDASREAKCLRYYLMEKLELVIPNTTQMNTDKTVEMMSMAMPDNEATFRTIIDTCNKKNAAITDNCDAAHEHSMCILEGCQNNKIPMPEIKD